MDFIEQVNEWNKGEVVQARTMVAIGALFVIVFLGIMRSEVQFMKGALIPVGLIILLLIGYGGYILYSRPLHAKQSVELYQKSQKEAVAKELVKHTNDNKAGKTLIKIYPVLAIISLLILMFVPNQYFKGMAMGFTFLFLITHIMDHGFIRRSDVVIAFLSKLSF